MLKLSGRYSNFYALAKEFNIPGRSKFKKSELIDAIVNRWTNFHFNNFEYFNKHNIKFVFIEQVDDKNQHPNINRELVHQLINADSLYTSPFAIEYSLGNAYTNKCYNDAPCFAQLSMYVTKEVNSLVCLFNNKDEQCKYLIEWWEWFTNDSPWADVCLTKGEDALCNGLFVNVAKYNPAICINTMTAARWPSEFSNEFKNYIKYRLEGFSQKQAAFLAMFIRERNNWEIKDGGHKCYDPTSHGFSGIYNFFKSGEFGKKQLGQTPWTVADNSHKYLITGAIIDDWYWIGSQKMSMNNPEYFKPFGVKKEGDGWGAIYSPDISFSDLKKFIKENL